MPRIVCPPTDTESEAASESILPSGVAFSLPAEGYVRLNRIVGPHGVIPVSRSTWWNWVAQGRVPRPVKFGAAISAWPVETIRQLIRDGIK